jgi:hypothetical protein
MTVLFFIPLTVIAFYESTSPKTRWLDDFINGTPLDEGDSPADCDPQVEGEDAGNGLVISRVPFSELVKEFPNTHEVSPCICYPIKHPDITILQSSEANIVKEIHQLKARLDAVIASLDEKKF